MRTGSFSGVTGTFCNRVVVRPVSVLGGLGSDSSGPVTPAPVLPSHWGAVSPGKLDQFFLTPSPRARPPPQGTRAQPGSWGCSASLQGHTLPLWGSSAPRPQLCGAEVVVTVLPLSCVSHETEGACVWPDC